MQTRLFQKPDFGNREAYLKDLDKKIFQKEREWEATSARVSKDTEELETKFLENKRTKESEITNLEAILVGKRAERENLEKPLTDRSHALDERENSLNLKDTDLQEREQDVFKREKDCDLKLESIKDMADEIGEIRLNLAHETEKLDGQKKILKGREDAHLLKVQAFAEDEKTRNETLQSREEQVSFKEISVRGKEENLVEREKELINGNILLKDRRGIVERAWKELEQKHGSTKRT